MRTFVILWDSKNCVNKNYGFRSYRMIYFGFNLKKKLTAIRGVGWYFRDFLKIRKQLKQQSDFQISSLYPILSDKFDQAGVMKGHYFHQDLLIAKKIHQSAPKKHVDIGSRIDGFVAHVAIFREIEIFDIRNMESNVENVVFKQADLSTRDFGLENYTDSISSLHAIEHFGLGRYGDSIDLNGHIKAIENIYKCLKPGGIFYFSVPIGPQRIEFNAHRVFSVSYLLNLFREKYDLVSFSFVNDAGDLILNQPTDKPEEVSGNFGCVHGCGIFELRKK